MGGMAQSMTAYSQPLLDQTDGSPEQIEHALSIAQMCWNLALLPGEEERKSFLAQMQSELNMNDRELTEFYESVVVPMIKRHNEIFPKKSSQTPAKKALRRPREEKYPGTGRNDPCPCNSGKKYKRCCGR